MHIDTRYCTSVHNRSKKSADLTLPSTDYTSHTCAGLIEQGTATKTKMSPLSLPAPVPVSTPTARHRATSRRRSASRRWRRDVRRAARDGWRWRRWWLSRAGAGSGSCSPKNTTHTHCADTERHRCKTLRDTGAKHRERPVPKTERRRCKTLRDTGAEQ